MNVIPSALCPSYIILLYEENLQKNMQESNAGQSAKYCKGETKDKSILQETSTNLAKMLHKIIPLICHATGGNHRVSKDIRGNQTTKIIRYLQDTHYQSGMTISKLSKIGNRHGEHKLQAIRK